jgi:trehalose 6-phosphate phosphatase
LFSAYGHAANSALMAVGKPLLAFDFDGTLAPIVARAEDARVPPPVASRMPQLCARWPVAVISGRSLADVSARLGFEPSFMIGNHGIEDPLGPPPERWSAALEPLRKQLRAHAGELVRHGVAVEDKTFSIALHYRMAPDLQKARRAIDDVLNGDVGELSIGGGKCVVNLACNGAPDKGDAVIALARRCQAEAGLFVGDDDNDEPAFAKVPANWLTVRVGQDAVHSQAAYYLEGPQQLPLLLQMLLDAAPPSGPTRRCA